MIQAWGCLTALLLMPVLIALGMARAFAVDRRDTVSPGVRDRLSAQSLAIGAAVGLVTAALIGSSMHSWGMMHGGFLLVWGGGAVAGGLSGGLLYSWRMQREVDKARKHKPRAR